LFSRCLSSLPYPLFYRLRPAILFATPTVTSPLNYGEVVRHSAPTSDLFDTTRPTIELPLDKIFMESGKCSEAWPMPVYLSVFFHR
jgi:hypothetical protein